MNKRQHKRFFITLQATVTIGEQTYEGLIGNVSEDGVASTITTYIKTDPHFSPIKAVALNFQLPSGDNIDLNCEIRWFLRPQETGKNLVLGLFILDPPAKYTEWIQKFN